MHEGTVLYARRNSVPCLASASRFGVRTAGCPRIDRQSPRNWSGMIRRIFGLAGARAAQTDDPPAPAQNAAHAAQQTPTRRREENRMPWLMTNSPVFRARQGAESLFPQK